MTLQTLVKELKSFAEPIQGALPKWLYLHLPPQPINSKKTHRAYATAVSVLMRERESGTLDHKSAKAIARYLSAVIPFIEGYEKNEFALSAVTPEDMLRFLMEQNGLTQYDLAKDLGGQSTVSNILLGKRKLTRDHIEALGKRFHVSPATFYLG